MTEADTNPLRSENSNNGILPLQEGFRERLLTRFFPTTDRKSAGTYVFNIGTGLGLFGSMGVAISISVPLFTIFYTEIGQNSIPLILDWASKGAIITGTGLGLFGALSGYMVAREEIECDQTGRTFYPPFYD